MGLDSEEYLLSRKIIGIVGCPLGDVKQGRGENMEMSYSYSMSFLKSQDQQKKKNREDKMLHAIRSIGRIPNTRIWPTMQICQLQNEPVCGSRARKT